MADLCFQQQLLLMVLDKAALGSLMGIAVFLGNRALERYKSRQAIREETAKLRLEKIAPLWEELSNIHVELQDIYIKACKIDLAESFSEQGILYRKEKGYKKPWEPMPGSVERFKKELLPQVHEVIQSIGRFRYTTAKTEFWLGQKLTKMIQEHTDDLYSLSSCMKKLLDNTNEWKLGEIAAEFTNVKLSKVDVDILVKLL
jgi:hypothetical protein